MIPFMKVVHVDENQSENNVTSDVLSIQISKGAEATKNTVTVELRNPQNKNTPIQLGRQFQIDKSSLIVYLDWKPITDQEPIISSTVSSVEFPTDNNGKYKIKIKGTDKSSILLSKLWAMSIEENTGWNAPESIIKVIEHLNDLEGAEARRVTTNHVTLTKQDGTPFTKKVNMAKIWKPGYEWLNELSQPEFTEEDRPYVYYIDAHNDLHWHYPYQKPATNLTDGIDAFTTTIPVQGTVGYPDEGIISIGDEIITYKGKTETSFTDCTRGAKGSLPTTHIKGTQVSGLYLFLGREDIYKMDITTTEDATYNFIIYNGGPTPRGYEYLQYTLDESEVGKKFRMKFFDWKAIGKSMRDYEMARGDWVDKESNWPPYPWTPGWTTEVCTTNKEYQASFEKEIERIANNKASAYFGQGKQKFKATVQLRGTTTYEVNDLVNVINPLFNKNLILRVKDVKHQVNKGSFITDLELEEDVEALQESEE